MSERIPPPEVVPEGYELVPAGERINETCKVHLVEGWVNYGTPPIDNLVRANGEDQGYLPYGYYCRPVKGGARCLKN